MSGCTATAHGSPSGSPTYLTAYVKLRCRCPDTVRFYALYKSRWRGGEPGMVDATATIRIVRGLQMRGHGVPDIAAAADVSRFGIDQIIRKPLGAGRKVQAHTATGIVRAARHLARIPGRARYASHLRRRAVELGWAPLHAWDGQLFRIDDPNADDALAARTAGMHPTLRRAVVEDERAAQLEAARLHEIRSNAARRKTA